MPHSETSGSPGASPSPERFAAWLRPSSAARRLGIHRPPFIAPVVPPVRSARTRVRLRPPRGPPRSQGRLVVRSIGQLRISSLASRLFLCSVRFRFRLPTSPARRFTHPRHPRLTTAMPGLWRLSSVLPGSGFPARRRAGIQPGRPDQSCCQGAPSQRWGDLVIVDHWHRSGSPGPSTGGAAGIRTPDLRRARAALSRLSYGPLCWARTRIPFRSGQGSPRRPVSSGRAWTRTRDLGLIRAAL